MFPPKKNMDFSEFADRLLFAVPKKGRLNEQCLKLLAGADIKFTRKNRLDIALCSNLPIALVFLNASDIAKYVGAGNVDLGITGQDMLAENGVPIEELLSLGFGTCKLQVLVPISSGIQSVDELIGKRIVTSFPNIVGSYFGNRELGKSHQDATVSFDKIIKPKETFINYVNGSVEAACVLGLADGIVDLVESGETMRAAKLIPISTLLTTEAVLICNPKKRSSNPLVEKIKNRIEGVIVADRYVLITYNVQTDKLAVAIKITPGRRAPTISPLDNSNWRSVSSMVLKKQVADIMDELAEVGAEDILVVEIHNCRVNKK
jgi:ATP phosphoribosyltransferase